MPYAMYNQQSIYYDDIGEGECVIFIHPPGMGRKTFVRQLPLQQHLRLILPDLSGHGESRKTTNHCTIADYANEIEAIRLHAGIEQLFVFGYSSGGTIAQEYALQYKNNVKGLILSGGFPLVASELFKVEHHLGIFMVNHFPKLLAKIIAMSHFHEKDLQQALYKEMLKANLSIWAQFYEASLTYNCLPRLSQLQAPLMLLYGEKSDSINMHVRFYEDITNKEVHFIKKASHQLPTRRHKQVNNYIEQFILHNG